MSSRGSSQSIDAGLIINLIMLFIPVLRLPGAIWMCARIKKKYRTHGWGTFWLIILTLMFASGALSEMVYGFVWWLLVIAAAVAAGVLANNAISSKRNDVLACLEGRDSCSIDELASALDMKEDWICRHVKFLRKTGRLPETTYIDTLRRVIVLTPDGRPAAEAPQVKKTDDNMPEGLSDYEKVIYAIRHLNDEIADETVSRKIDHIEATTDKIFRFVTEKPERAGEIQNFLEYYLPTTLKLLSSYAQLEKQGSSGGENIATSRQRIEGIMDKLTEGFDAQLDRLFKSDAVDITNDVKVLEKMMRMDGLSGH